MNFTLDDKIRLVTNTMENVPSVPDSPHQAGEHRFFLRTREVVVAFKPKSIIVLIFGIAATLCATGLLWWRYANAKTQKVLNQAHREFADDVKQNLPPGASRERVETFLKSRNFIFSDQTSSLSGSGADSESTIEARGTKEIGTPLASCFIFATFVLDRNQALVRYSQRSTCKGVF